MLPVVPKWVIWLIKHGIQLQHHPLVWNRVLPMVVSPQEALLIHPSILWTAFTVVWIPERTRATELCLWWRKLNLLGRKRQHFLYLRKMVSWMKIMSLNTDARRSDECLKEAYFHIQANSDEEHEFRVFPFKLSHCFMMQHKPVWGSRATVHSDRLATQHWDIVLSLLMDLVWESTLKSVFW